MATLQELESALIKADAAGNVEDARILTREIDRLISQQAPAAAPAPAPVQATAAPASSFDMRGGMYGLGQDAATVGLSRPAVANVVRYGGPLTTQLLVGSRMGAGGQMLTGAPAGALFETLALGIEGKPVTKEKVGAAAIYNMAPGVLPFSVATYSTAKNVIGLLGNA